MKLTILFLLITITMHSQWNFILENNKITWQKIYTTNNDIDYKNHFKENELTTNLEFFKIKPESFLSINKTTSFSNNFKLNNISKTKTFIEGFNIAGGLYVHVTIEFKKYKYRVTIKNIETTRRYYDPVGGATYNSQNNNYLSIESLMLDNKHRLKKDGIHKEIMEALQLYFNNAFTLDYEPKVNVDNW